MRMELAPFGVKVVTVIAGSVKTNLRANTTKERLPSTSLYLPAQDAIEKHGAGQDSINRGSPEGFAQDVVKDILKGACTKIWRGNNSTLVHYLPLVLPVSTQVSQRGFFGLQVGILTNVLNQDSILSKDTGLELIH
jgi:1-acylglycerone phosphate reductase